MNGLADMTWLVCKQTWQHGPEFSSDEPLEAENGDVRHFEGWIVVKSFVLFSMWRE